MPDTVLAEPLLGFTVTPDPNPLTVSPGEEPTPGALTITVGRGARDAYCRAVTVRIPVGPGADDLIASPEAVAGVRSSFIGGTDPDHGDGWSADTAVYSNGYCVVHTEPYWEPLFDGTWTVGIVLSHLEINREVGEAEIEIVESTGTVLGDWTEKTTTVRVPKFPPAFVFRDLRPNELSVPAGTTTVLQWEGSPAVYVMSYPGGSADVSNERAWTTPALQQTSSFTLRATIPGGNVTHALSTVVAVGTPSLKYRDLTVEQRLLVGSPPAAEIRPSDAIFDIPVHLTDSAVIDRLRTTGGAPTVTGTLSLGTGIADVGTVELGPNAQISTSGTIDLREVPGLRFTGTPRDITGREWTADADGFLLVTSPEGTGENRVVINNVEIVVQTNSTVSCPIRRGDQLSLTQPAQTVLIPFG
ncbi:hypothetical protein KO481_36470 [Nocardia sp. NEAU-G5]|uniref:Uncharacterized protein n=1 Tax=Nocardia albiluteola TaxID=2842303 RepID=A0ABS6BCR0_9NOCA|nr:hypothetical protein [Nocardia albiluteola]MBU3067003.1 hypothetical protein [Nocardia albiluteola]